MNITEPVTYFIFYLFNLWTQHFEFLFCFFPFLEYLWFYFLFMQCVGMLLKNKFAKHWMKNSKTELIKHLIWSKEKTKQMKLHFRKNKLTWWKNGTKLTQCKWKTFILEWIKWKQECSGNWLNISIHTINQNKQKQNWLLSWKISKNSLNLSF